MKPYISLNQKLELAGIETIRVGKGVYLQKGDTKIVRPICTSDIESKINKIFNVVLIEG